MSDSVRPVSESEERADPLQIDRHDLDRWKRRKLWIASPMIQVPVGMRHQEWKLYALLTRQQLQDRFCQGHRLRFGDDASIDQKRFVGANEKIDKICFKVRAWTLTQDKRLRFVLMDLKGILRRCTAI